GSQHPCGRTAYVDCDHFIAERGNPLARARNTSTTPPACEIPIGRRTIGSEITPRDGSCGGLRVNWGRRVFQPGGGIGELDALSDARSEAKEPLECGRLEDSAPTAGGGL